MSYKARIVRQTNSYDPISYLRITSTRERSNGFLRTPKPAGPIQFNKDRAFVFYDDGNYPAEYEISDVSELVLSQKAARVQREVALQVLHHLREQLNYKHDKSKFDEPSAGIKQVVEQLEIQDIKTRFVKDKIDAIRAAA